MLIVLQIIRRLKYLKKLENLKNRFGIKHLVISLVREFHLYLTDIIFIQRYSIKKLFTKIGRD